MALVRSKNTKPELVVRKHLHAAGLRYVLHDKKLPGQPDIVFPSRRVAIFVHGCFWHGHDGCKKATIPRTRPEFWQSKINANKARDARVTRELEVAGWDAIVVWQCSLNAKTLDELARRINTIEPDLLYVLRTKSGARYGF